MSTADPSGQANKGQQSRQANKSEVEFKRWYDSMWTMLGCLSSQYVQASSISFVPDQLKKSEAKAYMPRVVSIGPLHRGTRTDLLHMEDIKWRCMEYLLHRTENPEESLRNCGRTILGLDEIVRSSYNVVDIKLNRYKLAKIMLLDGCFLIELLICRSPNLNRKLKSSIELTRPGAEVGKREVVLSDLTVLENQIPFIILVKLGVELFLKDGSNMEDAEWERKMTLAETELKRTVLSLFGYSPDSKIDHIYNSAHILELVHSYTTAEIKEIEKTQKRQSKEKDHNSEIQVKNSHKTRTSGIDVRMEEFEMRIKCLEERMNSHLQVEKQPKATIIEIEEENDNLGGGKPPREQFERGQNYTEKPASIIVNNDEVEERKKSKDKHEIKEENKNQESKAEKSSVEELKLKHCATTLVAAGVTIEARKDATEGEKKG